MTCQNMVDNHNMLCKWFINSELKQGEFAVASLEKANPSQKTETAW